MSCPLFCGARLDLISACNEASQPRTQIPLPFFFCRCNSNHHHPKNPHLSPPSVRGREFLCSVCACGREDRSIDLWIEGIVVLFLVVALASVEAETAMAEEFVKPVSMEAACMAASDTHHDVDYDHCIRFLFVVLSSAKAADGGIHGLARLTIDDAASTVFRLDDLAQLEEEDEAAGKRVRSQMATQVASHAQKHFLRSTPGRRSASPASSTPSPSPDTMTSNGWCDWTKWLLELSPSGAWKHKGTITKGVFFASVCMYSTISTDFVPWFRTTINTDV